MYKKSDNAAIYNFKKFMIKIQLSGDNWVQTKNPSKGVWRYGIISGASSGFQPNQGKNTKFLQVVKIVLYIPRLWLII